MSTPATQSTTQPVGRDPIVTLLGDGARAMQVWPLSLDSQVLEEFLTYVFSHHWDQIVFGPIIEGAAYELTCPCAPKIRLFDGYLTINFGGAHFHLCIGENKGPPKNRTSEALKQRRKPSKAHIFRRLDREGAPISWGFEMQNGAGEPMISIFFASPFLTAGDKVDKNPVWSRLKMWHDISQRYLGRPPEAFDETGKGFWGNHC